MEINDVSRREFMCAAAVSAAAVSTLSITTAAAEDAPKPVRIGIVGTGNRGTFLTQTFLTIPGVQINAVCDIIPEHAANAQAIVEKASGKKPDAYTKNETDFENLCRRDDLDAVVNATPWQWHTPVSLAAMKAGKHAGTEVPAAITVDECWDLVKTAEATGKICMMLENVCYFQNVLTILRMVRENVFGDLIHCEAGYQHDGRYLMADDKGNLTWRGEHVASKNGNLYPTHPIGPIAQWMNINRGNRFTSLTSASTSAKGLKHFFAGKFGADHPLAQREYALGDVNTTLIKTANGQTVTLYFDIQIHRPYDLIFRVQGMNGIYLGTTEKICLEDGAKTEQWEPFEPYLEKYAHPMWASLEAEAKKNGGHGGGDYITLVEFVNAIRGIKPPPQDVYDAATWSVIFPLTIQSVANNSAWTDFPDFTNGKWKTNPPLPI